MSPLTAEYVPDAACTFGRDCSAPAGVAIPLLFVLGKLFNFMADTLWQLWQNLSSFNLPENQNRHHEKCPSRRSRAWSTLEFGFKGRSALWRVEDWAG